MKSNTAITTMTETIQPSAAKQNFLPLRAHHLFCAVLFQGKGYNENFTQEMTKIVSQLKEPNTELILLAGPDKICAHCPNLKPDGGCDLDAEKIATPTNDQDSDIISVKTVKTDTENKNAAITNIKANDNIILRHFGFPTGKQLPKAAVFHKIKDNLTKEFFEQCCHECRWYKQGLCSYEQYRKALEQSFF